MYTKLLIISTRAMAISTPAVETTQSHPLNKYPHMKHTVAMMSFGLDHGFLLRRGRISFVSCAFWCRHHTKQFLLIARQTTNETCTEQEEGRMKILQGEGRLRPTSNNNSSRGHSAGGKRSANIMLMKEAIHSNDACRCAEVRLCAFEPIWILLFWWAAWIFRFSPLPCHCAAACIHFIPNNLQMRSIVNLYMAPVCFFFPSERIWTGPPGYTVLPWG